MQILHQTIRRCQYIVLCWPFSESKVSGLLQFGKSSNLILKCNIARLDRQNRKFLPVLIITEAKSAHFFVCKRTGFVHEELRDFVKMTLTRVSSQWLWLEPSRVILWKTWLESGRVTVFLNVTQVRVTKNCNSSRVIVESSHWLESRYHCYLLSHAVWIVHYRWRPAKPNHFILKFYRLSNH